MEQRYVKRLAHLLALAAENPTGPEGTELQSLVLVRVSLVL